MNLGNLIRPSENIQDMRPLEPSIFQHMIAPYTAMGKYFSDPSLLFAPSDPNEGNIYPDANPLGPMNVERPPINNPLLASMVQYLQQNPPTGRELFINQHATHTTATKPKGSPQ